MIRLTLENESDVIDLNGLIHDGYGAQAISGLTGFGLPPVTPRWVEGAGDGAVWRGTRVNTRVIDLPLYVEGRSRDELLEFMTRLSRMFAGQFRLVAVHPGGERFYLECVRSGGGTYTYGEDTTGELTMKWIVTLTAGDPYWTSEKRQARRAELSADDAGLLDGLSSLYLTALTALDEVVVENTGGADTYPTIELNGPFTGFKLISPAGDVVEWTGVVAKGSKVIVDMKAGTVKDAAGVSLYSGLAASPRFWTIPPGIHTVGLNVVDAVAGEPITGSVVATNPVSNHSMESFTTHGSPGFYNTYPYPNASVTDWVLEENSSLVMANKVGTIPGDSRQWRIIEWALPPKYYDVLYFQKSWNDYIPCTPGQSLRIAFDYRCELAGAALVVEFFSATKGSLGTMSELMENGMTTKHYSLDFIAPSNAAYLAVSIAGNGGTFVDCLYVTEFFMGPPEHEIGTNAPKETTGTLVSVSDGSATYMPDIPTGTVRADTSLLCAESSDSWNSGGARSIKLFHLGNLSTAAPNAYVKVPVTAGAAPAGSYRIGAGYKVQGVAASPTSTTARAIGVELTDGTVLWGTQAANENGQGYLWWSATVTAEIAYVLLGAHDREAKRYMFWDSICIAPKDWSDEPIVLGATNTERHHYAVVSGVPTAYDVAIDPGTSVEIAWPERNWYLL